jgi:hypothetical protein
MNAPEENVGEGGGRGAVDMWAIRSKVVCPTSTETMERLMRL